MRRPATIHHPRTGQTLTFVEEPAASKRDRLRAELRLEPGGRVPRHAHTRITERLDVVEGSVEFRLGRDTHTLRAGEGIAVPKFKVHSAHNPGPGVAHCVLEVRPARRTEILMRVVFAVGRRPGRRLRPG